MLNRRALLTADDLAIGPVATLRGGFLCRSGHPLTELAQIDLAETEREIDRLEAELAAVRVKMKQHLKELGL